MSTYCTREKLGVLIEKGMSHPDVKEVINNYIARGHGSIEVCALGGALVGKFEDPFVALEKFEEYGEHYKAEHGEYARGHVICAHLLDASEDDAELVDSLHGHLRPAMSISAMLRSGLLPALV